MKSGHWQWSKELPALMDVPHVELRQRLNRIEVVERNLMLPLRLVALLIVFQSFFLTPWVGMVSSVFLVPVEYTQHVFWIYVLLSGVSAGVLIFLRALPPLLVEWTVFTQCLVDAVFLAALTVVTGGYDSILFWLFVCLVIRNSVSLPPGVLQVILNLFVSGCYGFASLVDTWVIDNLDEDTQRALDPMAGEGIAEPLAVRLALLWVTAACGFALQVLLERQRQASDEAREFEAREGQLRSAGRVAAQFAHQLKNPLAIINNCAYSLRKSLPADQPGPTQQLDIIQEEVARADQLITQVMGYAKLSEGRVEKINVTEELDGVIAEVFPPGAFPGIEVQRDYPGKFPPLLMQRRHFRDLIVSLLQNAAEALAGQGQIEVSARCRADYTTDITVRDNGPGIATEKLEQVFEAYYTTKSRGTGLGLAIVKHNAEIYGGSVRVESELGKGAAFHVSLPGKSVIKIGP